MKRFRGLWTELEFVTVWQYYHGQLSLSQGREQSKTRCYFIHLPQASSACADAGEPWGKLHKLASCKCCSAAGRAALTCWGLLARFCLLLYRSLSEAVQLDTDLRDFIHPKADFPQEICEQGCWSSLCGSCAERARRQTWRPLWGPKLELFEAPASRRRRLLWGL